MIGQGFFKRITWKLKQLRMIFSNDARCTVFRNENGDFTDDLPSAQLCDDSGLATGSGDLYFQTSGYHQKEAVTVVAFAYHHFTRNEVDAPGMHG